MDADNARLTLATDRCRRPIRFSDPIWSGQLGLAGMVLERHRVGPLGRLADFAVPDVLLGLCVGGSAQVEVGEGGRAQRLVMQPGRFMLLDRGEVQAPIAWSGTRETLYLRLPAAAMERVAPELADPDGLHVAPQYGREDTQISRLLLCLHDEAAAGNPTGSLYAESLALALISILASRYGAGARPAARVPGMAFTRTQRQSLQDFVQANLGRNIRLEELASVVGLSPHYFVRVFRDTFLVTPHQYLLRERTERAKRLLAADGASISDVGLALGFADQSHFANTFRRLTGRTPSQFRRDRR